MATVCFVFMKARRLWSIPRERLLLAISACFDGPIQQEPQDRCTFWPAKRSCKHLQTQALLCTCPVASTWLREQYVVNHIDISPAMYTLCLVESLTCDQWSFIRRLQSDLHIPTFLACHPWLLSLSPAMISRYLAHHLHSFPKPSASLPP